MAETERTDEWRQLNDRIIRLDFKVAKWVTVGGLIACFFVSAGGFGSFVLHEIYNTANGATAQLSGIQAKNEWILSTQKQLVAQLDSTKEEFEKLRSQFGIYLAAEAGRAAQSAVQVEVTKQAVIKTGEMPSGNWSICPGTPGIDLVCGNIDTSSVGISGEATRHYVLLTSLVGDGFVDSGVGYSAPQPNNSGYTVYITINAGDRFSAKQTFAVATEKHWKIRWVAVPMAPM